MKDESKPFWQTRAAKQQETLNLYRTEVDQWRKNDLRSLSESDLTETIQEIIAQTQAEIDERIASGEYVVAANSNKKQDIKLNGIFNDTLFKNHLCDNKNAPILIIEKTDLSDEPDVEVELDDVPFNKEKLQEALLRFMPLRCVLNYVFVPDIMVEGLIKNQERFKAVAAHEAGHILSGQYSPEALKSRYTSPFSQHDEVLADRMAALIHGNPKKYAEMVEEISKPCELWNTSTLSYPSTNYKARMTSRWAEILENEEVTDPLSGEITNMQKALDIFEKSKDLAYAVAKVRGIGIASDLDTKHK